MFKKLIILTVLLFISNAYAIDSKSINIDFFNRFNDDCLNFYINEAFQNNHNAKQAAARVEQYRQQAKYSLGKELPSFSVNANYLGVSVPKIDNFELKNNAFILPFMANYEADFLLKNRDKTRSAKKAYEAQIEEEKSVYLSLLSDVATVYVNILQYDGLIQYQAELVNAYQDILMNYEKKFSQGVIDTSTLNNAKKDCESENVILENLKKEREILLMQLAILTGNTPESIANLQRGTLSNLEYQGILPEEIPSDTVFARPDVMKSEKQLEKAKIDVRVARKDFLPTFNITGVWIFNTISPGTFFSWDSSLAAILAGASQDIFTGGRKIANLKIQKAKFEELFENYLQTNLEALKEVNTALCKINYDTEIDNHTKSKLIYERENFDKSKKKFAHGVISNTEYLNADTKLIMLSKEALNTKTQRIIDYFTLYKAVGGKL